VGRERLERYSLIGAENQAAVAAGLAGGEWFRSAVPRKRMKELMRRSDYPAVRDTAIWLGLILGFAGLGSALWLVWHSWWAVPFLLAYGILYGSTSDSRWHESGHGTAFKTRWIDESLYQLASFMIMRDPTTRVSVWCRVWLHRQVVGSRMIMKDASWYRLSSIQRVLNAVPCPDSCQRESDVEP
jgi:fatty acid desaturase